MTRARQDDLDMAAMWVARMDSGQWSAEDEAQIQQWLAGDSARHGVLLRTHAAWSTADRQMLVAADAGDATAGERAPGQWTRRAVAASIAAAGIAFVGGVVGRRRANAAASYATQVGEIRRVPLVDGSVMTINSGSELAVLMSEGERRIDINHGEAWFEVAKDAKRPFVVAARRVKAQAVGTAFSVRVREAGVEVLVNEGVVEAWSDDAALQKVRLVAGQRTLIGNDADIHPEPQAASSVDRALAWRGGMIDLEGETLGAAAEEFNRYNDRKIVIGNPRVAAEQIDGVFRVNDPEGFASALRDTLGVSVQLDDPTIIRIDHKNL